MNIKRFLLTATALVLTSATLVGCSANREIPPFSPEKEHLNEVMPLAYKYSEKEKELLAAGGLFCDYENEGVGTEYTGGAEEKVQIGIFTYRPKLSTFEVISSKDGNALLFERSAETAKNNKDSHIDLELASKIPAKSDFVAEIDIMPAAGDANVSLLQTIYRPSYGNVFGARLTVEKGELKWDGETLANISDDEFTKIACVMHQSEGTLDVYVNGYMVRYGLQYIKSSDIGHEPKQVRVIHSQSGEGSYIVDNIAAYRGSEPKYISRVSESDIEVVREYRFEGAEGRFEGDGGITVSDEKSTYNIIKLPDGRGALKNTVKSGETMALSVEGADAIRCLSTEVYITSDNCDYMLASFVGADWTPVLEIRGATLWNALQDREICELDVQKWVRIDIFTDGVRNTCSVYVNGYRYVDNVAVSASVLSQMRLIRIGGNSTPEKEYAVYLDNIRLYNATGVLGYKGIAPNAETKLYTVVSPDNYSYVTPSTAGELTVTDEVKGGGETVAKISGFKGRFVFTFGGTGLSKQETGDYDLTDIDAIRIRYYAPENAGRSFVLIFDCGTVYADASGKLYYDGSWKKGKDGKYTCDKYPGVVATTAKDDNGWSYFHYIITLDSEGWATVTLPMTMFIPNRAPDIRHIERIRMDSNGWDLEKKQNLNTLLPDSKAVYYIDTVELIDYDA